MNGNQNTLVGAKQTLNKVFIGIESFRLLSIPNLFFGNILLFDSTNIQCKQFAFTLLLAYSKINTNVKLLQIQR